MSIENGSTRVILTLNDTTTRIYGPECDKLLATGDLNAVDLRIGINGTATLQPYEGVESVLFQGRVKRFLRQRGDGNLTLEYPGKPTIVDYSLSEGRLTYQVDGGEIKFEEGIKALVLE